MNLPQPVQPQPTRRISSLDIVRGLAMALMALDHCRDFLASGPDLLAPLDPATTTPLRFFTRWVTHLCAPAFVFLTGVSARLSLERGGRTRAAKAGQMALRGLLLIALELTVVREAWTFGGGGGTYMLQVIWALGVALLATAGFVFAPDWLRAAVGLALCLGHNLLDPVVPADLGRLDWLWKLLHEGGRIPLGGPPAGALPRALGADAVLLVLYPALPWVGLMVAGLAAGRFWARPRPDKTWSTRPLLLALAGTTLVAGFILLRLAHGYGEPRDWRVFEEPARTLYSFLNVTKYPPSLQFLMATMGLSGLLLALAERPWGRCGQVLSVFGRTPLFFYVLHLYLLHAAGIAVALARRAWTDWPLTLPPSALPAEGTGVSLPWAYAVWLACLFLLYPPCRTYDRWRSGSKSPWASLL